jgi:hypothetical protein
MTQRYTKRDAENAFTQFAHSFGFPTGDKDGDYYLEGSDGYRIEQISGNSGTSHPFGSARHTAREFCNMCWLAIDALYRKESR